MPTLVKRRWQANPDAFGGRRARRGFTYEAFVPDDIADLDLSIPADVAELATAAAAAIVALGDQPPGGVSWEALARQLLRTESVASSRIEGLEISQRRLARASFGRAHRDLTAESVLGNVSAMVAAIELGSRRRPLTSRDVLAIHRTLLKDTPDHHLAGKLRTSQGWIGGGSTPERAAFVPAPEEHVPRLMEDLCLFASRDDVPAVIQAGVVHAQFETIHPFPDGNGRVGRCLIHVILRRRALTSGFVPPVSLVLGANAKAYVRGLEAFREGHVAEWCALFAAAVRTAGDEASRFGAAIARLRATWREAAGHPRAGSTADRLIETLPGIPILDAGTVETFASVSHQAARLALMSLERAGVIKRINVGKRNRAWEAVGLFEAIDASEDAARRRRRS